MHPGHTIGAVYLYRPAIDFRKSIGGLSALVEHERRVDAYERRFGEIPRMQFGTVDTRSAKHWSAGNPHYPPIPAIRARIRHDADGGEASRFADSERTSS